MTKFKLDEHFGKRLQALFLSAGFDTETVRDENLQGIPDSQLFNVCNRESRCLVTLDLDFSDIIRFPPSESTGIVILRPRKRVTITDLEKLILQLIEYIKRNSVKNQLWVVEKDRIRIHQSEKEILH
jgi:predicted nuclease of predicted toxin-antitoxin system